MKRYSGHDSGGGAFAVLATILAFAGLALAQGPPRLGAGPAPRPGVPMVFQGNFAGPAVMAVRPFRFRIVTGAPYQATATSVTTQTLADGNRIVRTSVFQVARDRQGRMRRAVRLGSIGPWPAHGNMIFITDPVAHRRFVINPLHKTYALLRLRGPRPGPPMWHPAPPNKRWPAETLSLGEREMDGLKVRGQRIVTTIPAGAIGNQAPIQVISERWYSPALRTVVEARHEDPRFGNTVYRLSGISRSNPPEKLFAPPPGYHQLRPRRLHR